MADEETPDPETQDASGEWADYRLTGGAERLDRSTEVGFFYEDWVGCSMLMFGCEPVKASGYGGKIKDAIKVQHILIEAYPDTDDDDEEPMHVQFDDVNIEQFGVVQGLLGATDAQNNVAGRIAEAKPFVDENGKEHPQYRWRAGSAPLMAWAKAMIDTYGVGDGDAAEALEGAINLTVGSEDAPANRDEMYRLASGREAAADF